MKVATPTQTRVFRLLIRRSLQAAAASAGASGPAEVQLKDHEVFNVLFEGFNLVLGTAQTSIALVRAEIANVEMFHNMRLTTARNNMLTVTVMSNIVSMCFACAHTVHNIFGMNLYSGLEDSPGVFQTVALSVVSITVAACAVLIYQFTAADILDDGDD